jgi:uncharacterized protein (DUF2062 family)/2-polyprenyl-3-methyl-5-hydroxy-6-metoxy-1,4-benzoquinol methylase
LPKALPAETKAEATGGGKLRSKLRLLWRRLRGGKLSRGRASGSVAVGLFIGSLPLYGFHLPLCLAVCLPLQLDVVVAYIAANISNPLVAPFLVTAEVEIGSFILTGKALAFDVDQARQNGISGFVLQAAVGSLVLGSVLAACGAGLTWAITARQTAKDPTEAAIRRTVARYGQAPSRDRFYVASKLRSDPAVGEVIELEGDFGAAIDAGCGRGQLGLLLLELGRVSRLLGFDWDERKVAMARAAGRTDATFGRAELTDFDWPEVDTVFLVDVLHYLPLALQNTVIERAAAALSTGGRIVIREVDAGPGNRARLTMLFERIGAKVGYNRAGALEYRSANDIAAKLRELGLVVEAAGGSKGSPLANVLIVGRKSATVTAPTR